MHSKQRRLFIKHSLTCAAAYPCALFNSKSLYAAWSALDFRTDPYADILKRLFNARSIIDSELLKISLPQTAENGAVVPITVSSDLDNIQRLYILVEKNPTPLAAAFTLSSELAVYLTARIKMAESCHVVVIAEQEGELLRNRQWVNVVLGGCGGG
jgi:sulfur-oxidizing protein SoxY